MLIYATRGNLTNPQTYMVGWFWKLCEQEATFVSEVEEVSYYFCGEKRYYSGLVFD